MALDKSTFETINPSRFTTFTFPNPLNPTSLLRVAVLDSPGPPADPPRVAAMLVPAGRESDWIFSSESGHLQLLLASPPPQLSRLVLVGGSPEDAPPRCRLPRNDSSFEVSLKLKLKPLFLALSPKSCFERGIPDIPILSYEDGVVSSVVLGVFVGSLVGEMLVEDVEIEGNENEGLEREFRRRLRFKRMPNLVQTQVRIVPKKGFGGGLGFVGIGEAEFRPDLRVLVHPYLAPMVASLGLIGGHIEERILGGFRPRALCLGVGGGALVSFLATRLGFEVSGVEEDEQVLRVGRDFFGLEEGEFVKLFVGDAMEFIEKVAILARGEHGCCFDCSNWDSVGAEFDVVMVDLDSRELENGVCAPPLDFRRKHVLLDARSVLSDKGILVINVVPQSSAVYETIKHDFREVFGDLHEIDVGNGENFVLIAAALPGKSSVREFENSFVAKLRMAISGAFMDSIRKI